MTNVACGEVCHRSFDAAGDWWRKEPADGTLARATLRRQVQVPTQRRIMGGLCNGVPSREFSEIHLLKSHAEVFVIKALIARIRIVSLKVNALVTRNWPPTRRKGRWCFVSMLRDKL